jgi:hypothetical protein
MKTTQALEALKAERERLDNVVAEAIRQRDEWLCTISNAVGNIDIGNRNRRHRMSAAGRKRISEAAKKRWAEKNKGKK